MPQLVRCQSVGRRGRGRQFSHVWTARGGRRERRGGVAVDGPAGLGDPLLARRLAALLATLAPVPRLVLLLRFQEDLDPSDIARELGLPINTVKSHLKRSLERLRTLYQEPQSP